MERAPLPPHERSWRHPSEIAAEERAVLRAETMPRSTRIAAMCSGTLGLLAVGALVLALNPRQGEAPIAISATTTPSSVEVPRDARTSTATVPVAVRAPVALGRWRAPGATARASHASAVLATPVGDGAQAVVTRAAVDRLGRAGEGLDALEVRLVSGATVEARVVGLTDDVVVVELERAVGSHAIAHIAPTADEVVTVLATPPVTIALADLADLTVEEGTPVLDADGDLVALCSHDDADETTVVTISETIVGATSGDR